MIKFEAEVSALSEQGMGVVKGPDAKSYFVRGAWPGDLAVVVVAEPPCDEKGRYGFGEIDSLIRPSPERVAPACPHLGGGEQDCGGCPWMIADYAHQLRYKVHRIRHAFKRVSLDAGVVGEPWPSPRIMGYRARAQFKTDGRKLGYAGRRGLSIAPVDACLVLNEPMSARLATLKGRLPNLDWTPHDDRAFTYIDINGESDISPEALKINRRAAFTQANPLQNERIKKWLQDSLAAFAREEGVLELFCGSGNLTEVVSSLGFRDILAVDIQSIALKDLVSQGLPEVTAFGCDLYAPGAVSAVLRESTSRRKRILLLNPPREGLKSLVPLVSRLAHLHTIFYISCNPVTLAFDLKKILGLNRGWRISSIQPVDMMPHTPHIEILGRLDR